MELFTATGKLIFFYNQKVWMFFELRRKLAQTPSTSSSAVNVLPLDFCLHRHPVSVNCLYNTRMVLSVGGSFAYFARNARCTVTTDLFMCYSNTHNNFDPRSGQFLTTYTRIAQWQKCELRLKTTYWAKKKFLIVPSICNMLRKYVSCGFPVINVCDLGVHYKILIISSDNFILFRPVLIYYPFFI